MQHLSLVSVFLLGLLSIATNGSATHVGAERSGRIKDPTQSLVGNIIQPTDVIIQPIGAAGQPIPPKDAIFFFIVLQVEFYRMTVQADGDQYLPRSPPFKRIFNDRLEFSAIPRRGFGMTYGGALFAVQSILHDMLYPPEGTSGFREHTWEVNLITGPRSEEEMGTLSLFKMLGPLLNTTANTSSLISSLSADLNSQPPSSPLATPWPVRGTSVALAFGQRGLALTPSAVIWPLVLLVGKGWVDAASYHRVGRIGKIVFSDKTGAVRVTVQPRMQQIDRGGQPLMTDTDLVEASAGIVFYMLAHGFVATTVMVIRSDERGIKVPVGDIEIADMRPLVQQAGAGNASLVETA